MENNSNKTRYYFVMIKADAFFILPTGRVIEVQYFHIQTIYQDPVVFGLNKEYIASVFHSFNEPLNFEGKAREQIISEVLKKGFIRVRYRIKTDCFTFQVYSFNEKEQKLITDFIDSIKSKQIFSFQGNGIFSDYTVLDIQGNTILTGSIS